MIIMIIRLSGKSFKGLVTKLKPDMERLLASLETGSMSIPIKFEASSSLDCTLCINTNQPVIGVTLKVKSISVPSFDRKYENWTTFVNIFNVTLVV